MKICEKMKQVELAIAMLLFRHTVNETAETGGAIQEKVGGHMSGSIYGSKARLP